MADADIGSFPYQQKIAGSFFNSSLTMVYAPVRKEVNSDYLVENPDLPYDSERDDDDVLGLKLYGLIETTDLDIYYLNHTRKKTIRWGLDFAANLSKNFEIHGEYAKSDFENADSYEQALVGLRYLTDNETTWIMEYYYDSSGFTREESEDLYQGKISPQTIQLLQQDRTTNRNYAYLQVSLKEPFEILYFTPSLAWIRNLDDESDNLLGKLSYTPSGHWSAQASWQHFQGKRYTQYGENLIKDKVEIELTLAF